MCKATLLIMAKNWKWKQFTPPSGRMNRYIVIPAQGRAYLAVRVTSSHKLPQDS